MPRGSLSLRLAYRSVGSSEGIGGRRTIPTRNSITTGCGNHQTRVSQTTRGIRNFVVRLTDDSRSTVRSRRGRGWFARRSGTRNDRLRSSTCSRAGSSGWTTLGTRCVGHGPADAKAANPATIDCHVPLSYPMRTSMFESPCAAQVTNIPFWRAGKGMSTSERGSNSIESTAAIREYARRIMVLMTHNTEVADSGSVKVKIRRCYTSSTERYAMASTSSACEGR